MADGAFSGWSGPTATTADGQTLPLIEIKPTGGGNLGGVNMSSHDIDALVRTTAAEAGNQGPKGQQAVAHVILNRSNNTGKSPVSVVTQPGQFEGYDNGNASKITPDSEQYKTVANNISGVLSGQVPDPTNGATHFYSPKAQAALGRNPPAWAKGEGQQIGDHVFYNNVEGEHAPSSSNQITDDDLKGATPVVTRGSVGVVARPDNQVSDEDLAGAKPYLVGNQAADNAPPVQAPKSPGYQKALAQAQQNPNALGQAVTGTLAQVPGVGLATNIPGAGNYINSALNGFLAHGLPVIQGSANAIGQALHNLISKKSGVSAGEAYAAGRDASQQALSSYGKQHPILNTAADLGGQVGASALIPEAKGVGLAARLLSGAAKVGGQSALTGAGGAASEGQSGADIAKSAAVNGALGTVLSPVGELGQGAAMLGKSAGTKAALRYLTPAAATGAITGGATYHFTHNPADAALAALGGSALAGAPGLAQSKIAQKALSKVITSEAKSAALMHLTKAIGAETPEGAAAVLASKPGKSVVEALNEDHRQNVMQTAGELNPNNLQHAQQVIEARQHPTAVKGRLKTSLEKAIGENPEHVSERITSAPHEEAAQLAANGAKEKAELEAKATPEALVSNGVSGISKAVGVDPRTAESTWEGITKNNRETVSKPLWEKVATTEPGLTPDHAKILAEEPIAREALSRAQKVLGDEGSVEVPNPKFNPNASKPITPQEISDNYAKYLKDYLEAQGKGEAPSSKTTSGWATPEEIADWKNQGAGQNEPETITVPTKKAMIQMERDLRYKYMPRDAFGKVDYSNPQTREVERTQQSINAANKQHYEGLEEAKAASGEDLASERANENAYDFNPKSLNSESAEKFIERYNKLGDMQQKATRYGYLERFFQKFRENPVSTAKEYLNSDQHQKVMKAMLGDKADAMNAQLNKTIATAERAKNFKPETSGPIAETIEQRPQVNW
jgi:hypothetical protein